MEIKVAEEKDFVFINNGIGKNKDKKSNKKKLLNLSLNNLQRKKRKLIPYIHLITGPMFAQKTTTLDAVLNKYVASGFNCLLIKYSKDIRYTNKPAIFTHDKRELMGAKVVVVNDISNVEEEYAFLIEGSSEMHTIKTNDENAGLSTNSNFFDNIDVIAIEEGHFYTKGLVEICEKWVKDKIVIVTALSSDFRRKPFPEIALLQARSEKVTSLSAICEVCKGDAHWSARIADAKALELIGGKDLYLPVCRMCYPLVSAHGDNDND